MSSDIATRVIDVDDARIERVEEPTTAEELCQLLANPHSASQSVLVFGGGTRLAFGNLGGPFDVAISTARLNRVIQYEPDDMTLAVEPGCTIAQIDALLADQGQHIALDVALPERATIGASYATGLSGPRRLSGGSLKDWVIGVEVVGPDGVVGKAGGMVVKNVTGYDMMHVHYGAVGAFGIVTRINLKVFPKPGAERSVRLGYSSALDAYDAGLAVLRSQLQPSSVLVASDGEWVLHVRCDAPDAAIERLTQRIIDAASAVNRPERTSVTTNGRDATAPFVRILDLTLPDAAARLSIPTSGQRQALTRLAARDGWRTCADLGSGLVYVAATPSDDWLSRIREIEPRASILALPVSLKRDLDIFGPLNEASATIVRRLKQSFDPGARINRGRFVLGL